MSKLLPVVLVLLALAPPAAPAPDRAHGKATLSVDGGVATKKTRYFAPSQEVVVRGVVKPYVPNEVLTLYAIRHGLVEA